MSQVILMYRNILENSTVTVTTENASYPKYRLYDRAIGKYFKGTAPANPFSIVVGQSPVYEVNSLVIPVGHNFNGLVMYLYHSPNGSSWTEATHWTQGDANLIYKTFSAETKVYWKLEIYAPATIVQLTEMFLTKAYTFAKNPSYTGNIAIRRNILRDQTQAGLSRTVKLGELKRARRYTVLVETTQKTEFQNWENLCQGFKPFYIIDHEGTAIFMENQVEMEFTFIAPLYWNCNLDLLEVL